MAKVHIAVVPLLCIALLVSSIMISECFVKKPKVVCLDSEKQALLSFKQDIGDDYQKNITLSTWVSEDDECCRWYGVVCDNVTGHVSELQLGHASLSGKISPSLLNLKHLTHLNLSFIVFERIKFPSFLGSLVSLTHLDLAGVWVGMIPLQLGNLSNLRHLGIGSYRSNLLYAKNLDWLSGLSSLEYLEMYNVNLREASSNLLSPINKLTSLSELRLSKCELHNIHLLSLKNLTSIQLLDLSFNNLEGSSSLCSLFKTMTHLWSLDLSFNDNLGSTFLRCLNYTFINLQHLSLGGIGLQGVIPSVISNMTSLISLDLSSNSLKGNLPSSLRSSLDSLDLSYNKLSGPISESFGSFSNLKYLDISSNLWHGVVTKVHLANLTNLKSFAASNNSLTLSVTPDWIPPFNLDVLDLRDWKLDPQFPMWLKTQKNISYVDLSNTGISDVIPNWFHNISSQLEVVILSHNHLYGVVPIWFWNITTQLGILILSHNHLHGVLPYVLTQVSVDLSFNKFTGPLPHISYEVEWLDLSGNYFSGGLHGLLCKDEAYERNLIMLRLGENLLTGNIPNCWEHWTQLIALDLRSNHLVGEIPTSMGLLSGLRSLSLGKNNLTGEIPASLKNCSQLQVLNLGQNKLVGTIPRWIGSFSIFRILILRSNRLNGDIPIELCEIDKLQVLDVSDNNLFGVIPHCFSKNTFATNSNGDSSIAILHTYDDIVVEIVDLVTKGKENRYDSILGLVTLIDLSSNNLSGEIPEELTSLQGLLFLNLSRNHLRGSIPNKIGNMTSLESLDLSWNKLSGDIPPSMSSLTFLNFLNLSRNNLSGEIPKSTQLQSLNSSSFEGNQLLCGDPLPKRCRSEDNNTSRPPSKDEEDEDEDEDGEEYWFRVGVGVGFVVGFLGIVSPLVLSGFWRRAYFWFLQEYIWYQILDCIIQIKYITGVREPLA